MQEFKKKYPKVHRAIEIGGAVAKTAVAAMGIASTIASVINAEHKHVDTISSASQNNSTPLVLALTNIAQGATDATRNGNSVLAKHIYIKAHVINNDVNCRWCRLMLIQDTNDCAGTAPTIAQILQNYSGAYCGLSAHNKVFTDRFKVLWDKTLTVTANQPRASAKIYKKFKVKTYTKPNGRAMILGTHMTYSGPNSGDTSKNMLYLIAIANSDTATTMTLTAYCRFGYVDN